MPVPSLLTKAVFRQGTPVAYANRTVFSQTTVTNCAKLLMVAAVLAAYPSAQADIQSRNLEPRAQVKLQLLQRGELRCEVVRWDGLGLEGSCGAVAWDAFAAGPALAALKSIVGDRDAEACADAATVVLSIDDSGAPARSALDWARKAGADAARLDRVRAEARDLRQKRQSAAAAARAERLQRLTPEAGVFGTTPWPALHSDDFAAVGAASIEEARALLARTGGSATLHESQHIALLAESGDKALVKETVALERFYAAWRGEFEKASITLSAQGRIPVIVVQDRDRWRLLVQTAFGGDAERHPDAVAIYPTTGLPAAPRPIVLVRPDSDPLRQRYNASLGMARAILHLAGSPARPPAWLNEALPKVMADQAVPDAKMDAVLRERGLAAVRRGADFSAVLGAGYGDGLWESDPALAQSLAYMFARWIDENAPERLLRYAKAPRTSEPEDARFKRHFGMTIAEANARAVKWFQTND